MAGNGGDEPESLLSASFNVMKKLTWRKGATKSIVVMTDADFLSPDHDGVTYDQVVQLSKTIDPVNFYIITDPEHADSYTALANDTDGKVVTSFDELTLLTDYIMDRYDSLPRVEETEDIPEKPVLNIISAEQDAQGAAIIKFENGGERAVVILNDKILGITAETEIKIEGIDFTKQNTVALVPISGDLRGETVFVDLTTTEGLGGVDGIIIPKAPNTGRK